MLCEEKLKGKQKHHSPHFSPEREKLNKHPEPQGRREGTWEDRELSGGPESWMRSQRSQRAKGPPGARKGLSERKGRWDIVNPLVFKPKEQTEGMAGERAC